MAFTTLHPGARRRASITLPRLISATLLICLALLLWEMVRSSSAYPTKPTARLMATSQPQTQPRDFPRGHVFGLAPPVEQAHYDFSHGDLKLDGIVVADDPESSRAIISIGGNELILAIGDQLPTGESVSEITSTSVLISWLGGQRRLDWDVHGAPADAVFTTLPVLDSAGNLLSSSPIPTSGIKIDVNQAKFMPVVARLAELRKQVLQAEKTKTALASSLHPAPPN